MSRANVRCTNDKIWVSQDGHQFTVCGWKGVRVNDLRAAELSEPAYKAAVTAKPCPRCGGRIVLLEEGES